jgi:chromosome segregation ATPase
MHVIVVYVCNWNSRLREMSGEVERLKKHLQEAADGSQDQYDERQREIETLQERLQQAHLDLQANEALVADYRELQRRYTAKEMECETNGQAQANLESVLQQFQAEQATKWRAVEVELRDARDMTAQAKRSLADSKALQERVDAAEAAMKEKQAALAAAQDWARKLDIERRTLRQGFEATMERLKKFSSDDHAIDRRLVVKLLTTFFERQEKDDVLELMMRMLQFTAEEKQRVLQHRRGSGIGGKIKSLASFLPMLSPFDSGEKMYTPDPSGDQNLGDLWVTHLLLLPTFCFLSSFLIWLNNNNGAHGKSNRSISY